ncbi:MAG: hypothetical protein MUE63_13455 [Xanthomonadales bacterium]|nr:hypothetical protein [Xanthomonadales bacterium]
MASNRSERMGSRQGLAGLVDSLRYHEASRQGIGLLLLLVCAWFVVPAGENRILAGFVIAALGQAWRIYAAGVIYKNKRLATTGAYSLVRHPLYLGNFLILARFSCCFTTRRRSATRITSCRACSEMNGKPGARGPRRCSPRACAGAPTRMPSGMRSSR